MIAKSYILANLDRLDRLYNDFAASKKGALFCAKLAIIELCGWIEVSMDDMVSRCANRNLREVDNRKHVNSRVIKRIHGFEYDQHFRGMLAQVVGLKEVEKLEGRVDAAKFAKMRASLSALKLRRDDLAHTYLKGMTPVLDAPSLTKLRFLDVYDGLSELEAGMKKLRL